jgi:hypothetical protein
MSCRGLGAGFNLASQTDRRAVTAGVNTRLGGGGCRYDVDAKKNFRELKIEIVNPELRKQGLRVSHREGHVFGQPSAAARGK